MCTTIDKGVLYTKCWRPQGSTPRPLLQIESLQIPITNLPPFMPCNGYGFHYIYGFILYYTEKVAGRGLAPTHGFITHHRTMYKYMRVDLKCMDQSLYIVLCHIYIVSVIPLCNVRAVVHLCGVFKNI